MITKNDEKLSGQRLNNKDSSDIGKIVYSSILHLADGDSLSEDTLKKLEKGLEDKRVSKEHKKLIRKIKKELD